MAGKSDHSCDYSIYGSDVNSPLSSIQMAESYEVSAFQRCFRLLQLGLQHELTTITPTLFAKSLISSENRDRALSRNELPHERAAHLLSVLESRIRVDPASFHSIIRGLDSCPALQVLAMKLRSELERVKGEREQQQRSSTEVSTEEAHGASSTLTSQPACVCPTSLDVQQQITFLEGQFANLVMQLICMLTVLERKSDDFVDVVRAAVLAIPLSLKNQHHLFLESQRKKLRRASTVTDILNSLCSYWNYLNVSLFEYIVEQFGGDEMKAKLKVYLEHLKDFRQKTKLGDFIDTLGEDRTALPPEFVEVQMRMGNSWDNRTLEDAEQLRLRLCRKAMIVSYGLYFTGGRRKCIILTWGVAERMVSSLLSVLDDAEQVECDVLATDCNTVLPTAEHTAKTEDVGLAVRPSIRVPLSPVPTGIASTTAEYKIILLGDLGVGKTTFFLRIKEGDIVDMDARPTTSTLGVGFLEYSITVGGSEVKAFLYDTGGGERFRTLTSNFYRHADAAILMYSVDDLYTFENLQEWIENALDSVPDIDSFVWAIIGNKSDLPQEVEHKSIDARCGQLLTPLSFFVSAKTGDNVTAAFDIIVQYLHKQKSGKSVISKARAREDIRFRIRQPHPSVMYSRSARCSC